MREWISCAMSGGLPGDIMIGAGRRWCGPGDRAVSEAQADLQRQLEAQWAAYAATLAAKLDELERTARPLREDAPADQARQALEAVRGMSHRLAGSGATFGFAALGRVARDLEVLCDAIPEDGAPPSPEQLGNIDGLLEDLRRSAEVPPDPPLAAPGQSSGRRPRRPPAIGKGPSSWWRMTKRRRANWSGT